MIKSLKLNNFKCYEESGRIPFSRLTILSGQNGRGKSSVIQALLSLSQSIERSGIKDMRLNGRNVQLGDFSDVLNYRAKNKQFSMEVTTDDVIDSRLRFVFVQDSVNDSLAKIDHLFVDGRDFVSSEELITSNGETLLDANDKQLSVRVLLPTSDVVGLNSLRQLSYIGADRIGPVNFVDYVSPTSFDSVGTRGEYVINLLEHKGMEFQEQVRTTLSEIFDGASLEVKADGNRIVIRMDSSDEGAFFKPTNVGYGYGYLLTIITSVMNAMEKSVIFIENPEAHLHPAAQSRLMSFLNRISKEKGVQVIIETHSDHIINAAMVAVNKHELKPQNVRVLFFEKRYGGRITIQRLKITNQGRILNPPVGFCDQIDKDLSIIVGF